MGTKVHSKSYSPGYYSMRDLNEDSSGSSWSLFYSDKARRNGHYCSGFLPLTLPDAYPGYDRDALKQKMLEHETIFRNQVYELHRLYGIQRDMMDEIKRKELRNHRIPIETSSSSTPLAYHVPYEDARRWQFSKLPFANSISAGPSAPVTEITSSPLSFTKRNGTCEGSVATKIGEVFDSTPSKGRKKLFDLQLPADEYFNSKEREESQREKISDISSYLPSRHHNSPPEKNEKLFLSGTKVDLQGDASRSSSNLRSSVGLADLNEPIQVEETTVTTSIDFLSRGEIKGSDLSAKLASRFVGSLNEISLISQYGSSNEASTDVQFENRRDWLHYNKYEGRNKCNLNSPSQDLESGKFPLPSQSNNTLPNNVHQRPDYNKGDIWREKTGHGLHISGRDRDILKSSNLEPIGAAHRPSSYPLVNSSDFPNTCSQFGESWENPSNSLTRNLASVHTHSFFDSSANFSWSSQSPAQNLDILGKKSHVHSSCSSNPVIDYCGSSSFSKDLPPSFSSAKYDYLSCKRERSINYGSGSHLKGFKVADSKSKDLNLNMVLQRNSSNEGASHGGLEVIDLEKKYEDDTENLPWLRATRNSEAANTRSDLNSTKMSFFRSPSDRFSIAKSPIQVDNEAPNLTDSNSIKISFLGASSNQFLTKSERPQDFTATIASRDQNVGKEKNETSKSRKILGFPIFENVGTPRNETSSLVSTSASICCPPQGVMGTKKESRNGEIDINLACDPVVSEPGEQIDVAVLVVEKEIGSKVANFRAHIDLNSCMSEDEVIVAPSMAETNASVKIALEIDLEAPVPELEEDIPCGEELKETPSGSSQHRDEHSQEEVVRVAAEAIVSLSSSSHLCHTNRTTCHSLDASLEDTLQWFVEVVSNYVDDPERSKVRNEATEADGGDKDKTCCNEIDDFEAMTLRLNEVTEDEYMPKPLVPDSNKVEETEATNVSTRGRRGPTRRGRQRRDFQRDILPGIVSLSRHEVTEDLQTFGGLMRAMGHPWLCGSTRRNGTRSGGGRGRRKRLVADPDPNPTPLIQQLNIIETGLEDRSLTGWGKTTRRPRRQRLPAAGNPISVTLT